MLTRQRDRARDEFVSKMTTKNNAHLFHNLDNNFRLCVKTVLVFEFQQFFVGYELKKVKNKSMSFT
jgi:hypothetical protein